MEWMWRLPHPPNYVVCDTLVEQVTHVLCRWRSACVHLYTYVQGDVLCTHSWRVCGDHHIEGLKEAIMGAHYGVQVDTSSA